MNQNGACRLCSKNAKLLKKAHVIPNFMYKGIIHDGHMILANIKDTNKPAQKMQSGFWEKYILCEKCDNVLLGQLERYASSILYGGKNDATFTSQIDKNGIEVLEIKGVDSTKFKLFILSILWRAHISSNPFFKDVHIPQHEQKLRQLILRSASGRDNEYLIRIVGVKNNKGDLVNAALPPFVFKIGNGELASFFINGIFYFIRLDESCDFGLFNAFKSSRNDEITIIKLSGKLAKGYMTSLGMPEAMANFYLYPSFP